MRPLDEEGCFLFYRIKRHNIWKISMKVKRFLI